MSTVNSETHKGERMRRDQNTYPKNEGFFWVEENDDDAGTFHFTSCSTFFDRSRFLFKTTCILIDALRVCEREGRRRERQKMNFGSKLLNNNFSSAFDDV